MVAAVVLVAYGLWLAAFFGSGHEPKDMIFMGRPFIDRSQASPVISAQSSYKHIAPSGYDGQFFYYIALDPVNARYYIDVSTYRYTRILYPMVARVAALGRPNLIPWTLFLVNWLAIAGGALALAAWLAKKGISPWFALVYGLYPGLHIGLQRDLSEPLAYGLTAAAIYLFDFGPARRHWPAAIVFALAALTRESTALFALFYGGAVLFSGSPAEPWQSRLAQNARRAAAFLAIALVPLLLWKAFVVLWLGAGNDVGIPLARVPFQGLWYWHDWGAPGRAEEISSVVVPGLIAGGAAAIALYRRTVGPAVFLLLANVLAFVVFLQPDAYTEIQASSRVAAGVVLAAVLCLPVIAKAHQRAWFWVSSALWLSLMPIWLILPTAGYFLRLVRR
jgi:hypothetical protein